MRKCFEISVRGCQLRGVLHTSHSSTNDLGLIILHPGFLPRSGQGDFAVKLADAIAEAGVPAVRIDMPGLGDSEGELPEDTFAFIDLTQDGALSEVAWECVDQIQKELGFRKLIIGGHCGGAITGFFALAAARRPDVVGMFALETMFHIAHSNAPTETTGAPLNRNAWQLRREVLRQEMRATLLNSPVGGAIQKFAQRTREMLKPKRTAPVAPATPQPNPERKAQELRELPAEANRPLLSCVEKVVRSNLPMLFVTADDPTKPSDFDYVEYVLARGRGRARHERLFGTDHGFLSGGGAQRVMDCLTKWIEADIQQQKACAA